MSEEDAEIRANNPTQAGTYYYGQQQDNSPQSGKVYKYEYDRIEDDWKMTEGRWGGVREEKLFNRFDPNPDNYYIAAENYQQAEMFKRDIPEQQQVMNISRASKQWDRDEMLAEQQLESVSIVKEIRQELYQDLQTTEQEYYNTSAADNNHKKAVFQELYHTNDFATPERTQQFLAEVRQGEYSQFRETSFDNANPADIAGAAFKNAYQQQLRGFVLASNNTNDLEQYAERETRTQIIAQERQATFITNDPTNRAEIVEQSQDYNSSRNYSLQEQRQPEVSSTNFTENQWANPTNNPFEQSRNNPFAGASAEWER